MEVGESCKCNHRAGEARFLLTERFPWGCQSPVRGVFEIPPGCCVEIQSPDDNRLHRIFEHLAGELPTPTGCKFLNGLDVSNYSPLQLARKAIAFGSARLRVFPSLNLEDHFRIRTHTLGERDSGDWLTWAKDNFSVLRGAPNTLCGNFSGGEQQCVMLALQLMGSPQLVVLEEPWMGLAAGVRSEIFGVSRSLIARGTSFIFLSQQTDDGYVSAVSDGAWDSRIIKLA